MRSARVGGLFVCELTRAFLHAHRFFQLHLLQTRRIVIHLQLLAMDLSAQGTMKDAAKCDRHCEWQNSANQ